MGQNMFQKTSHNSGKQVWKASGQIPEVTHPSDKYATFMRQETATLRETIQREPKQQNNIVHSSFQLFKRKCMPYAKYTNLSVTACINSSTRSSYAWPLILLCLNPMQRGSFSNSCQRTEKKFQFQIKRFSKKHNRPFFFC